MRPHKTFIKPHMTTSDKIRADKARQDKTRQVKTRQDKTTRDRAQHEETRRRDETRGDGTTGLCYRRPKPRYTIPQAVERSFESSQAGSTWPTANLLRVNLIHGNGQCRKKAVEL